LKFRPRDGANVNHEVVSKSAQTRARVGEITKRLAARFLGHNQFGDRFRDTPARDFVGPARHKKSRRLDHDIVAKNVESLCKSGSGNLQGNANRTQ
jgi:hypothetical protein